jgi:glycosyltransferase involved in cell wall biosynthesis
MTAMKIAVITCYDQNDYVRARTLRTALAAVPGVDVKIIRNSRKGFLRYVEVPLKILAVRLTTRPDAYVITFRGYEVLPFTILAKGRRPLIFDELVNAIEFLQEHNRIKAGSLFARWFVPWYSRLLKRCRFVLADTASHALYSAELTKLPTSHYRVIPMAADENLFYPQSAKRSAQPKKFIVFYYGNAMRPLQGLEYILKAAVLLKDQPEIVFQIVGGHAKAAAVCRQAVIQGAHLEYESWIDFEEFPRRIHAADVTLGGPFGKTLQSQFVVPGKTTQFMACAKPVVIGRNLAQDAFVDRQNCLRVPQADAQAIADAVLWASKHRAQLKKIGLAGRALYERQFSQRVVNRAIRELVRELA